MWRWVLTAEHVAGLPLIVGGCLSASQESLSCRKVVAEITFTSSPPPHRIGLSIIGPHWPLSVFACSPDKFNGF